MKQSMAGGALPPAAALEQRQRREWTQLVNEVAQLAVQDDQNAFRMGDSLLTIEQEYTPAHVKIAAEQAGITWSQARERLWVAKKVPAGHRLRDLPLSFSHLRAVAGSAAMEQWADAAVTHSWSVATLRDQIARDGDRQAQATGQPCIQCEQPLTEDHTIIAFSIGKGKRARLCSLPCARDYFTEACQEVPHG